MNKIEIEQVNNGYIVSWEEKWAVCEGENDLHTVSRLIVIEDDGEMADKDALTELCYFIAEHFGETYNKFDKNNLNIQWDRKGHKLE